MIKQYTIIIPTFEKWKAIQLTNQNLKEFKIFLAEHNEHIIDIYSSFTNENEYDKLAISFYWNPCQYDSTTIVTLKLGEIFMYNIENPDIYKIIKPKDIKEEWYIHAD